MNLPPVWTTDLNELRDAAQRVHVCVGELKQPRIYHLAVMLSVLVRQGRVTAWASWDTPPPATASSVGRADLVRAMWELFGTRIDALIDPGSSLVAAMGNPARVLLDPFYKAQRDPDNLRLVGDRTIGATRADSAALALSSPYWVWSSSAAAAAPVFLEYNPVNSLNQQNGVGCALSADEALTHAPNDPGSLYAVPRGQCMRRLHHVGSEPVCAINDKTCGGQGDGAARNATKPRLLAPPTTGASAWMLLPDSLAELVALATDGGSVPLPSAKDLALLASWCHTNGKGPQGPMRLMNLLGPDGVQLLTSTT